MTASARWLFLLLALFCASAWAEPNAEAAREQSQPGNNQPFWLDAQAGRVGITNAQNIDAGVLINTGGELWRRLHEGPFPFWGAIWLAGVPAAILAFWLVFGPIRLHGAESGRMVRRFAAWERALHWTVAICFILLALTGFTLFFGKYYVEALLTYPVYSWVAKVAVSLHNFTAPVFTVAMVSLFLAFVKRNLWRAYDWQWLRRFGGLLGGGEPPSGFFNAGEKIWFWFGVTALGLIMVCSGAVLLLPVYEFLGDRRTEVKSRLPGYKVRQAFWERVIDSEIPNLLSSGYVDEAWAKEHHSSWYQDLKAGRVGEASDAPLIPSARPVVWRQTD